MPTTGCAYEKPSRMSQALVVCFSVAVIVMSAWFLKMIMFTKYGTTSVADDTEIEMVAPGTAGNVSSDPDRPPQAAPFNSAYFEPSARDNGFATAVQPRPSLPLASVAEPPSADPRDAEPLSLPVATVAPDASYRGVQPDQPLRAEALAAPADASAESTPLPPPPVVPRMRGRSAWGLAAIPMPRPRPRLEAEEVAPAPEQAQSIFNLLMYGPR